SSLLDRLSAERDDVADMELAQPAGPLDGGWLRNVMEAVPGLEQQVALVSKLVRQASSHDPAGDHGSGLDLGHHHGDMGIREPRLMARPGLDDVAADLRLSER